MSAQIKRFIVPDAYRTHPVKIIADGFTATVVLHTDHLAAIAAERAQRDKLASHLEFAVTMLTVAGLGGNAQVNAMRTALAELTPQ